MVRLDAEVSVALLQLSDLHLLADPAGRHRGVLAAQAFDHALVQALDQCPRLPQWLLLSGDLCQDESWQGYVALRHRLERLPIPIALLPGNHDQPQLLRSCLGRSACIAPALLPLGAWQMLLLDSHCAGQTRGCIPEPQLRWAERALRHCAQPVVLSVHHPVDHFRQAPAWLERLRRQAELKVMLVGHIHQHREDAPSGVVQLGCPSTLVQFSPQQPCPLGQATWPGGRWLEFDADGQWRHTLLRWSP